jgi:DNA-directed RNA polymerase subunit RPC12/RpoP
MPREEEIIDTCGHCGSLVNYVDAPYFDKDSGNVRMDYECPECGSEGYVEWEAKPKDTVITEYHWTTDLEPGDRIEVVQKMTNYPNAEVEEGERGTVIDTHEANQKGDIMVEVRMDTPHEGLKAWGNTFHVYPKHQPDDSMKRIHDAENIEKAQELKS